LRFEFQTFHERTHQPAAVVNYPNTHPWTRITELKYLSAQELPDTTVVIEYTQRNVPGVNEPYYPIPKPDCRQQYERYLETARELNGSVVFAGRLADYRYYNMDQAVARALAVFESLVGVSETENDRMVMSA
jgi:UDP-galactopyranose mutase